MGRRSARGLPREPHRLGHQGLRERGGVREVTRAAASRSHSQRHRAHERPGADVPPRNGRRSTARPRRRGADLEAHRARQEHVPPGGYPPPLHHRPDAGDQAGGGRGHAPAPRVLRSRGGQHHDPPRRPPETHPQAAGRASGGVQPLPTAGFAAPALRPPHEGPPKAGAGGGDLANPDESRHLEDASDRASPESLDGRSPDASRRGPGGRLGARSLHRVAAHPPGGRGQDRRPPRDPEAAAGREQDPGPGRALDAGVRLPQDPEVRPPAGSSRTPAGGRAR